VTATTTEPAVITAALPLVDGDAEPRSTALMVLIAAGIGQIVTPLLLGYAIAFAYVVLGITEGRAPIQAQVTLESSNGPPSNRGADDDETL